jgi:23S rRNA pseudouridine2605 synthase
LELIRAHRIAVNGAIRVDPQASVRLGRDRIAVDGREIGAATRVYLAMNKPRGIVTTAADEKGRKTVYDCLNHDLPWVAPVGRLDKASEGLLLLTNDSQWGARVSAPKTHLDKTYHVQIACVADAELIAKITEGVTAVEGDPLQAKVARILRRGEKNTWLEIVLDEGKNRHIRRMLAALGIEVLRLVRVAIGPLLLGDLPKGASRPLTETEKKSLDAAINQGIRGARR